MIDIHSHIINNIDDGSSSMEMSLHMAKIAENDGITDVITTPHITEITDWGDVCFKLKNLQDKIYRNGLKLKLHSGAETPFRLLVNGIKPVTLSDSDFILVEFPHGIAASVPDYTENIFRRYLKEGYKIIIAHPERNFFFLKNKDKLKELILPGVFLQVTAMSFKGSFGKSIQFFSSELLKNKMIDFIATDSHDDKFRIPQMKFLLKSEKNKKYHKLLDKILNLNPEMIFSNGQ
jgi:protein-tyrosine phosphatase